MEEVIALVEHCKNFFRDNAHQIRAASNITGALNGP